MRVYTSLENTIVNQVFACPKGALRNAAQTMSAMCTSTRKIGNQTSWAVFHDRLRSFAMSKSHSRSAVIWYPLLGIRWCFRLDSPACRQSRNRCRTFLFVSWRQGRSVGCIALRKQNEHSRHPFIQTCRCTLQSARVRPAVSAHGSQSGSGGQIHGVVRWPSTVQARVTTP